MKVCKGLLPPNVARGCIDEDGIALPHLDGASKIYVQFAAAVAGGVPAMVSVGGPKSTLVIEELCEGASSYGFKITSSAPEEVHEISDVRPDGRVSISAASGEQLDITIGCDDEAYVEACREVLGDETTGVEERTSGRAAIQTSKPGEKRKRTQRSSSVPKMPKVTAGGK